jgi:hypothetical protein
MLTAIVLVCALTIPVRDCGQHNARQIIRVPSPQDDSGNPIGFGHPVTCLMHGQAFLAELSIGEIGADEYPKVSCTNRSNPNNRIG